MPANPPKSSVLIVHRLSTPPTTTKNVVKTRPADILNHCPPTQTDYVSRLHDHHVGPNQCCSSVVQNISAPVSTVWSVVRCFDNPQAYKHFVKSCHVINGDGNVGTLREVHVISGLPAASSTERLEILDDERHVLSFSIVGGDHRLMNYRSVTTLHASTTGTTVVESYVVDIPLGNTMEDSCVFIDTIVKCNLNSLGKIAENLAACGDKKSSNKDGKQ